MITCHLNFAATNLSKWIKGKKTPSSYIKAITKYNIHSKSINILLHINKYIYFPGIIHHTYGSLTHFVFKMRSHTSPES